MASLNLCRMKHLEVAWLIAFSSFLFYAASTPAPTTPNQEDKDIVFIRVSLARNPATIFTSYPVFKQEIDQTQTLYKIYNGANKNGRAVFHRKSNDTDQNVIILAESEDRLPYTTTGEDNRIYVVLIQNPLNPKIYHAAFAYARNVPPGEPNDESVITINKEKRRIEWDVWSERAYYGKNKAAALGWTTCLESFFIPCKPVFPDLEDEEISEDLTEQGVPPERINFRTTSELNADENFDFFGDLDDSNDQANFVGAITRSVTEVVQFFADVTTNPNKDLRNIRTPEDLVKSPSGGEFMTMLLKDLETIGTYSFPPAQGKVRPTNRIMAEGFRVLEGLFNNSASDKTPENLTILTFAADDGETRANPANRVAGSGRGIKKTTSTSSSSSSASSSSSSSSSSKKTTTKVTKTQGKKKRSVSQASAAAELIQDASDDTEKSRRGMLDGLFNLLGPPPSAGQAEAVQGYIPGKVGGKINGEDWRVFCARPGISEGDKTFCSCHIGKDFAWGLSEDLGDSVSKLISGETINDNPSFLDPIFNDVIPEVFCGTVGKAIDLVNSVIGKALGLDKLLGVVGQAAGTVISSAGGLPVMIGHLIHQGIKAAAQGLGIAQVFGMQQKGPGLLGGLFGGRGIKIAGVTDVGVGEPVPPVQTDVDLFGQLGWRTQDIANNNDIKHDFELHMNSSNRKTLGMPKEYFLGFGTCPIDESESADDRLNHLRSLESIHDVAHAYHIILRTHCLEKQIVVLNDLLADGAFVLNEDKSLSIAENSPDIKRTVLNERVLDRVSLSFSLAAFSQAYIHIATEPNLQPQNPLGRSISRNVRTLTIFTLISLQEYRQHARLHFIKLARDLVQTLKTAFSKSLQDFFRFQHAAFNLDAKDKEEAHNDIFTILGLIQFIIEGLGPVETYGLSVQDAWETFFNLNHDLLSQKLKFYTQP